jgi:alpha-galactosidase
MSPAQKTNSRRIRLAGRRSCVMIECVDAEPPRWLYWGPALTADLGYWTSDARAIPPASLDIDQPFTIAPTFGVGWFGQSALLAHREGRQFAQAWTDCTTSQTSSQEIKFVLVDDIAGIELTITMAFEVDSDVLALQSTLRNTGQGVLDVQWLAAATLLLPQNVSAVESTAGVWANEFQSGCPKQIPLTQSNQWRMESRRGRGGHDNFPGALVVAANTDQHSGLAYGAQLAWSGNHTALIEALDDGHYQWQLGEWLAPGEVRLQHGESLRSPVVYAVCSDEGRDGIAREFHDLIRRRLPWPEQTMRPRPVHLNTWEAVYFDHDEQDLKALATAAAAMGVERFVLDDGWFHGRVSDRAGLGDWCADEDKYPHGLAPLAKHVVASGMEFGLWVEPEMVNPNSDLYRAHPDWALQLDHRPQLSARNQLVLDLKRNEVAEYLFEKLCALLQYAPITYLKWDMNRDLCCAGHDECAAYRGQVHALYALLARLRAMFPALEIESCASGGARLDTGILAHTHRVWTSDNHDAVSRVAIQRAALQWLPAEVLGAHVGAVPSHATGRTQSLAFRAAVALPLHFGLELDVRRLSEQDRSTLQQWIALYRQLRNELHVRPIWMGECGDGVVWQAHGDAHSSIVFIYRLTPTTQRQPPSLRLPLVQASMHYRLTRLDPIAHDAKTSSSAGVAPLWKALQSQGVTVAGDWLAQAGLPLPRMFAETAMVLRVQASSTEK